MRKILYIVNVDWFFVSHRLPLAIEALKNGYEVHIACEIIDKKEYLENLGLKVHPLNILRSGTGINDEIKAFIEIYKVLKEINPDIAHFITIKPILYGGIASRFLNIYNKVFSISGLGFIFIQQGFKASIVRTLIKTIYRFALSGRNSHVVVQNPDDKTVVSSIVKVPTTLIRGSGVNLSHYKYNEENNENLKVSMACRLLKDKGVLEYIEASRVLKNKYPNVEFELYGDIDIYNPASLTSTDIRNIEKDSIVKVYGFSSDIARVFSDSNIVVLPSYREGLPKVLIEAAACGRAVVTTDVPGCRDAIEPNITGLLCEVKNPKSLAEQIEKLILNNDLRNNMGKAGRELAEKEFDINKVVKKHFEIYQDKKIKKILYIINVDWFFISHFLPVGLESVKRGYEVHIACGITDKKEYLESLGLKVYPLNISRSGTGIKVELKTIIEIYKIIKSIDPQVLEFFTIKPVLYGGMISRFLKIPKKVFYITGLGYVFIAKGLKGFIVRNIVKMLYKLAISGKNSSIITENIYDKELINSLNAVNYNQIKIIRGAGVDLSKYSYIEENNENIKVSMACRLSKDKGVFEYIEAAKFLKQKLPNVEFELYGDIDIHNPASLTVEDVENIKEDGFVNVYGFSSDIAKVFSDSNIVVLPSYREGLPKVLIEAAACGRAVVTTDVPGCRDAIEPNITGLLCKVKDSKSLASMIEKLIVDKNSRNSMGTAGRELAEKEFDINKVVEKHFEIYEGKK